MSALDSIYISPLETCNLNCKYCYTKKTKTTLSSEQILDFINRYQNFLKKFRSQQFFGDIQPGNGLAGDKKFADKKSSLKSIIFCGGEVFLLPWFTDLINNLLDQNIFISIITNGTLDKLSEIKNPQNCQLLVSFDGPKTIHDQNRGTGNFDKSINFVKHAQKLGFPVEIFYLVTSESYPFVKTFPSSLYKLYNLPAGRQDFKNLSFTYLTDRLHSLTSTQILNIKRNYPTYPRKNFGCFQLALQSDGYIYGCCESPTPLAKISDPISKIIINFTGSLFTCQKCKLFQEVNNFSAHSECDISRNPKVASTAKICLPKTKCHGCCSPEFLCGYQKELGVSSCQEVVKLFS